jgi:hypothetical protein
MLVIRPEQFAAFDSVAEEDLQDRTIEHLRENHADETVRLPTGEFKVQDLSDETMLELVKHGFKRAREYGFTWESSLVSFVVLMITVAPNFDEQPAIKEVLQDESVEEDLRIDKLFEQTTEEDWETAEAQYEQEAWQLHTGGENNNYGC